MSKFNHAGRAALVTAIALCFAAPAFAQGGGGSNSMQTAPLTKDGTAPATTKPADVGVTGNQPAKSGPAAQAPISTSRGAADNTNSKSGPAASMDPWATTYAGANQGYISRQAYVDEMGRRFDKMDSAKRAGTTREAFLEDLGRQFDAMDSSKRGLTPAEVSRITGKVDVSVSALPRTGSDVQAGNMGPTNVKK